ncbi:hypothetical protein [Arenimonas metalli]|uniref:hypothetical protein n=1 Tax=Arenimonas metalli TaxID=948077 RepID=UPI0012EC415B|nr:hypothetical protein [Arenimonas metalli]
MKPSLDISSRDYRLFVAAIAIPTVIAGLYLWLRSDEPAPGPSEWIMFRDGLSETNRTACKQKPLDQDGSPSPLYEFTCTPDPNKPPLKFVTPHPDTQPQTWTPEPPHIREAPEEPARAS